MVEEPEYPIVVITPKKVCSWVGLNGPYSERNKDYRVSGFNPSENMKVSWDDEIPNRMEK